jgi:hypothetical protein
LLTPNRGFRYQGRPVLGVRQEEGRGGASLNDSEKIAFFHDGELFVVDLDLSLKDMRFIHHSDAELHGLPC